MSRIGLWELVEMVKSPSHPRYRDAHAELHRRYRPRVEAIFVRLGWPRGEIDDATQEFFRAVVLERGLFTRARRKDASGRVHDDIHGLLGTAVEQFSRDLRRRRVAVKRRATLVPLDLASAADPRTDAIPAVGTAASDRRWIEDFIQAALRDCRDGCLEAGLDRHWEAFRCYVVRPAVFGCVTPNREALARRLNFRRGDDLSAALQVVKRRFEASMRRLLMERLRSRERVDEEMRFVLRAMNVA